jgi:hypothetical protein
MTLLLYLDQNYLSGMVKRKPAFRELEPVLRAAVARDAVRVPESWAHHAESEPRPDLDLLRLLRELSGGLRLPDEPGARERRYERHMARVAAAHFPERHSRESDAVDLRAIALALPRCRLITCDAFMADVVRRTGLDRLCDAELYTGRRADVDHLRRRLEGLEQEPPTGRPGRAGPPARDQASRGTG